MNNKKNKNLGPNEIVQSWAGLFNFKKENGNAMGLRSPQIGALYALMGHMEDGEKSAIVVMPTGTGKTETMIAFMVANLCRKIFIIVPSDSLRSQTYRKFRSLGLLKMLGTVPDNIHLPKVTMMTSNPSLKEWKSIIDNSNVIIATMALASRITNSVLSYLQQNISHLFVDEAHHSKAETWSKFINIFPSHNVILFTATPFRNDGQRLSGKIVFNFSLKKAQEQHYYEKIQYYPILKYSIEDADHAIAEKAVSILQSDLQNGYDHIIMARCKSKKRAEAVFDIYQKKYPEYSPVIVYSGISKFRSILRGILERKHRIIVCVDMLGEGYDLPQLKIAAIHDEKQSLPVTLQFIGRFTRTNEQNLGPASFITNLAYPPIAEEINKLYQIDADWNCILPRINESSTHQIQSLSDFLSGFHGDLSNEISLEDIRPALSTEIYTTDSTTTSFPNWKEGVNNLIKYEYTLSASSNDTLVIVLGKKTLVQWGDTQTIHNLNWDIIVVYFDAHHKRAYLNSSIKLRGKSFLKHIINNPVKLQDDCIYRVFDNIDRLRLFNVGARLQGKDISFQSYFGKSVQDGLDLLTQGKLLKNNIFGVGFKKGNKTSIGCSSKGRIWSRERADLHQFQKWCKEIGDIVFDDSIDTNIVLKNTLKIDTLTSFPSIVPISIDWCPDMYDSCSQQVIIGGSMRLFDDLEMVIEKDTSIGNDIIFSIKDEAHSTKLRIHVENNRCKFTHISGDSLYFCNGNEELSPDDFFQEKPLTIYYADNSISYGIKICRPKNQAEEIPNELISTMDWRNVDLTKESQKSDPYITDSIQYHMVQQIIDHYEFLIDDDGSGEIADLVGIKTTNEVIDITLYHLKFAYNGHISNRIDNLYQVCGQAQKCIRWKYSNGISLFNHFLKRDEQRLKKGKSSRILKGKQHDMIKLREEATNKKELQFHVVIVQPGMSKSNCTHEMKLLLGTTVQVLKQMANIDCKVICSD